MEQELEGPEDTVGQEDPKGHEQWPQKVCRRLPLMPETTSRQKTWIVQVQEPVSTVLDSRPDVRGPTPDHAEGLLKSSEQVTARKFGSGLEKSQKV